MGTALATLQVVVIEDHPAVAAGVGKLFDDEPDLEVAGTARDYAEAVSVTERLRPDAAIVDVHLPGGNGIQLAQELVERKLSRAAVVYTASVDDRTVLAALVAGASAIVAKGAPGRELVSAVRAASRGAPFRPRVTIDGLVEAGGTVHPDDLAILGMLVHGTTPQDIGQVLGVHERELASRRRRMVGALLAGTA